ncbi:MAG: hypothetical protein ABIK62_01210, partial [candidate division WOR-3 bacterium]
MFLPLIAWAQIRSAILGVEPLSNGNTLVVEAGDISLGLAGRVFEVNPRGRLVWAYVKSDIFWAHTARRLANGNTLITDTYNDRVIEVDPSGQLVWVMAGGLSYPNEAYRLANGNTLITDRDNNRVIEVDLNRNTVWEFTGVTSPHNAQRLPNGNTLICDSGRNRVIEVNASGAIVWEFSRGISLPKSAQRLPDGNTLITSAGDCRVIEVSPTGTVRWSYSTMPAQPFASIRTDHGQTLISAGQAFYVDSLGSIAWEWPRTELSDLIALQVFNPSSGCSLSVHIHRPAYSSPEEPLPAVVLIPDSLLPGTAFDANLLSEIIANNGFVVMHFDPEGRGESPGFEDYCGTIHQDGLKACLATLAAQSFVDPGRIGIIAEGLGTTMAAGMLNRYSASARVSFLVDFEGPADRFQTCADSGGPVPVSPESSLFWQNREAVRFMSSINCPYLRIQTAVDHNPRLADARACIALVDSATAGLSPWTRVNDSAQNLTNRIYSLQDPPVLIPETE